MVMSKLFHIIVNVFCISVIAVLGFVVGYLFYHFFGNVFFKFEIFPAVFSMYALLAFLSCMIVSGIMSFYNKIFSKVCFGFGLLALLAFVLGYNYISVFRPDLYVIVG